MIVEDINSKDVVGPDMNVDALATKYAEYLSTLNAGQVVNKVNAQSVYHDRPHGKAKKQTNGSSGSSKPKQGPQRGPQEWHKTAKRHGCGEVGHIKHFCPNKNKTDVKTGSEDSPVPISSARIKELTSCMERRDRNGAHSATVCETTPALLEQRDQVCGTRPQHDGVGLVPQRCTWQASKTGP